MARIQRRPRRRTASPARPPIGKFRTLADQLAPLEAAWEAGHRGAIGDALRECRQWTAPLPTWLALAVEEVVSWWEREAPTGKRGRHARAVVARRDAVQDLLRLRFYEAQRARRLPADDALAMTAEWFRGGDGGESTIRDSLARARRMSAGSRYLALDDRRQKLAWLKDPQKAREEIRRLGELVKRYPPPDAQR